MGGALLRVWRFVRLTWWSLRRTPTRRDGDGAVCEMQRNREGEDGNEGRPEEEAAKLDELGGTNDGALTEQVPKVDGCQKVTERVDTGAPEPEGTNNRGEVDGGRDRRGHIRPPAVEPAALERGAPEPGESGGLEQEGSGEPGAAEPEGQSAEEPPRKPSRPRRPRRQPSETGGARGAVRQRESASLDDEGRERAPRVERARIVCRKTAGRWDLVVVPAPGGVVRGVGDAGQAGRAEGEVRATQFGSAVVIEDMAGAQVEELPLFAGEPLVFRLGNDWQGEGRKVGGVGVGHFVAMVPKEWTRLGEVPVAPEPCVDDGFRAHYFYRDRNDRGAVDGFAERGVSSSAIDLVGERVFDASDQGELFVGRLPALKAPGMAWARVGEEGTRGWGDTFRLDGGRSLEDVLEGREGRFFVRVYREGVGAEADSVQFRYLADLRGIRVAGEPYADDTLLVPSAGGHGAVNVEIACAEESEAGVTEAWSGTVELDVRGGAVVCPPDRELKEVRCRVEGPRGGVDVVVELPRVWWGFARAGRAPQPWRDAAQMVPREEFRRLAFAGAEMWIDVPRGLRRVGVGFGDDSRIDHPVRREGVGYRCVVPLTHYLDHAQIDRRLFQDAVLAGHFGESEIELVHVAAELPPRVAEFSVAPDRVSPGDVVVTRWAVKDCEGVSVSVAPGVGPVDGEGSCEIRIEHPTVVRLTLSAPGMEDVVEERAIEVENPRSAGDEQPVAQARAVGGWRPAKGFSEGELSAVPLAEHLPLRIDRRRRSVHRVNVASLERWTSGRR